MDERRKVPSLVDLCIRTAIDNVRHIGNVGEVDTHLLQRILPHCTVDQLLHIEDSTEGRDLSSVTDELWQRFYEKQFGKENADLVVNRMKQKRVVFKWRQLYEAKTKEREEFQNKLGAKLKQRYQEEQDKKSSRQVKYTMKKPPSNKRSFFASGNSSYNVSNLKSNILKKAKIESLNSHEAQIHATMRKNALQQKSSPPPSFYREAKLGSYPRTSPASTSKQAKSAERRYRS